VSSPSALNALETKTAVEQPPRCKHKHLLEDQDIKRWYDNLCRGSKVTADVYLRRLLVNLHHTSPEEHDRWIDRNRIYGYTQFLEVLEQIEENLSRIKLSGP
jgi:hypothetical protein